MGVEHSQARIPARLTALEHMLPDMLLKISWLQDLPISVPSRLPMLLE